LPKQTREGAVDSICSAITVGMNGNARIATLGPMLPAARIHQIGFGFEKAGLSDRQFQRPASVRLRLHGQIAPGCARRFDTARMSIDDFAPERCGAAEIRAKHRTPTLRGWRENLIPHFEVDTVSHEMEQAAARGGGHHWYK